jgi:hypothetical protein
LAKKNWPGGGHSAVTIKDSLIAYNYQVNQIPLSPLHNLLNLALRPQRHRYSTNDHVEAMSAALSANILEAIAVSGVDANSLKPPGGNIGNVRLNNALVLTAAL